jgi:cellulose synthase/poly-beta-1,6-N-acetylglucosamine synthase-like glycosyltransferase
MRRAVGPNSSGRPQSHFLAILIYAAITAGSIAYFGLGRTAAFMAWGLMIVFFFFFIRHLGFAISAARWVEQDLYAADVGLSDYVPTVAVFVGCKDEVLVVDKLVRALFRLDYPTERLQLIIVDDGSTDGTGEKLDYWAELDGRLTVVHRPSGAGGGKSGALNAALELVDAEIICVFDADHEPAGDVIRRLVRHFLDEKVDCVMGRCVIRNGNESQLAGVVFIDFLSGYLVNEYGRQALYELPAYGGANCAVRRSTLVRLGGWNTETVTEDTDLTIRVLLAGGRVRYDPTAVDFEEAVLVARRFWKQRYRWARGHQKCTRDYLIPTLRSPNLSWGEKAEFVMFLFIYHIPVLSGLGIVLTAARLFGIGNIPAVALLPLTLLLFLGPLAELTVGLLLGRVERRGAWHLIGFLPSFALSIVITTWAYVDGMLGRPYSWVKTTRSGQVASHYSVTTIVNNPLMLRRTSDADRVDTKTSEGAMMATTGLLLRSGGLDETSAVGTRTFARVKAT